MGRGERRKAKPEEVDEGEEEEKKEKSSKWVVVSDEDDDEEANEGEEKEKKKKPSKCVVSVSDEDDDEEGNEDLSLKIVEKALLVRATKLEKNDGNGVVSDGPGLANRSGVVELSSSSMDSLQVNASLNEIKKKKKKKTPSGDQSVIIVNEGEKTQTIEKTETVNRASTTELVEIEDDPNAVDTSVNTVLQKLLRGPRYFDLPENGGWSTCYHCGEAGHMALKCPSSTKKKKPCFVCGSLDHGAKQCRKDQYCVICKKVGHRAKDCQERHTGGDQSSKICLKCGNSGHFMFSCSNGYSHDDLKEIQCYICKSYGHLCCAKYMDDSPREVSCYRCGELGHAASACSKLHEESTSTISSCLCYKCGKVGHFARECSTTTRAGKRIHESSAPTAIVHGESKDSLGIKSAPHDLVKKNKKRKTKSEERGTSTRQKAKHRGLWRTEDSGDLSEALPQRSSFSTPSKSKHRGGWIMEDPGDSSKSNSRQKMEVPSTSYNVASGSHVSSPHSFSQGHRSHPRTPVFQNGFSRSFQHGFSRPSHGYSASRFGQFSNSNRGFSNDYDNYGSGGRTGQYGWW